MSGFGIKSAAESANPLFPAGEFRFLIEECELKESPKGGKDGVFKLKVLEGPHINKTKTFNFAASRTSNDEKAVAAVTAGHANISRISLACGINVPEPHLLKGKNFIGTIEHKNGWANLTECKKDTGPSAVSQTATEPTGEIKNPF
jgi:hypothetical protein